MDNKTDRRSFLKIAGAFACLATLTPSDIFLTPQLSKQTLQPFGKTLYYKDYRITTDWKFEFKDFIPDSMSDKYYYAYIHAYPMKSIRGRSELDNTRLFYYVRITVYTKDMKDGNILLEDLQNGYSTLYSMLEADEMLGCPVTYDNDLYITPDLEGIKILNDRCGRCGFDKGWHETELGYKAVFNYRLILEEGKRKGSTTNGGKQPLYNREMLFAEGCNLDTYIPQNLISLNEVKKRYPRYYSHAAYGGEERRLDRVRRGVSKGELRGWSPFLNRTYVIKNPTSFIG